MVTLGNKVLCSGCFAPIKKEPCRKCGFSEESYVPDSMTLPVGTVLMGNFVIGRVLGRGGFGVTYLAYDVKYGKVIAVKEYFPIELALRRPGETGLMVRDRKSAELFKSGVLKFYNEAGFIARFAEDAGVVRVYQFFYENNTAYFTMEYLTGMTLKDYVTNCGRLTAGQALRVAEQAAATLRQIHSQNVLHRDVCPDNIMLCSDGSVKILDFGSARQVFPEGSQLLTVILKPGFAPIEQYMRKGRQGEWTDIYALAASVYYGLTGQIPENPQNRLEDDSDMADNRYRIDPQLWAVLYKAMMLKYTDRYATTEAFCEALAAVPLRRQNIRISGRMIRRSDADSPLRQLLAKLWKG